MKIRTKKVIDVNEWDQLVMETYGRPYTFQQQDGCKSRGVANMKKYPYLMILKGKHGDHYFHVNSESDFIDTCRKIFNINNENRLYCFQEDNEYDAKITNLQEQIIRMTDPSIHELIDESKLRAYQNNLCYYVNDKVDARLFEMAKIDDVVMATFVMSRSNKEYEQIITETYS